MNQLIQFTKVLAILLFILEPVNNKDLEFKFRCSQYTKSNKAFLLNEENCKLDIFVFDKDSSTQIYN